MQVKNGRSRSRTAEGGCFHKNLQLPWSAARCHPRDASLQRPRSPRM